MALNPFRVGRPAATPTYVTLTFRAGAEWTLSAKPTARGVEVALADDPTYAAPSKPVVLVERSRSAGALDVHPLNTTRPTRGLCSPKYDTLTTISFERFSWLGDVSDREGATSLLGNLPKGFVRSPEFGLGLDRELDVIVGTLEEAGVDTLVIRGGRRDGLPSLTGTTFTLAAIQFDELRRAVRRIHDKSLELADEEKARISHNTLLTAMDAERFPEQPPVYHPNGVTAVIASRSGEDLSPKDQAAVIAAATSAARPALKRDRPALLQLSRTIETVTLRQLIQTYTGLLDAKVSETKWQSFFRDNPFVLRLAFGYPVVQMGDQISVGGQGFHRTGGKISDFAVRAATTGNLALIEIKTGETLLLEREAYRGKVYGPHRELAGGVSQVLDQVYQVQRHIASLKDNSDDDETETFAVQALVIAGRTPEERNRRKSFDIYRHSLRAVTVITFDELLGKLSSLADFLEAPQPAIAASVDEAAPGKG